MRPGGIAYPRYRIDSIGAVVTSVRADQGLLRARTAVVVTFATSGIAFASFASRTPAVREALGLTTAQLGLLLLCMSAGSLAGLRSEERRVGKECRCRWSAYG